jgi:ribosome-associated protein
VLKSQLSLNCHDCLATFEIPKRRGLATRYKEDNVLSLHAEAVKAADGPVAVMATKSEITSEALLAEILSSLTDDKGEDIVQVDLRGKSSMGDYMVIASGRSTRQVAAMSEKLAERLKAEFGLVARMEGKDTGDWVLIDTGDVIVHVFRPEVREFYQLEKMWASETLAVTN